ncbi:MAG: hypothetical protein EA397_05745 [Deltaproteobacteria bacterium]|nr:MAG: hypothetical protein EA397_05745 [Deltaproteobacteria bacterium]
MSIYRTVPVLWVALGLHGCAIVSEGRDILAGLTNPLVVQTLVLGVELPSGADNITFPEEFSAGSTGTAFLADAGNVADLENAPISGAEVWMQAEVLDEAGPGAYTLAPGAMAYAAGQEWSLRVSTGGNREASARISLAPAADFELPLVHPAEASLTINLTDQGFDGAFVVVNDAEGNITFDNRPQGIREFYDFTRGEPAGIIEIPGEAFPDAGPYAVGVAGIQTTTGRDNMERMNTALSSMMSGNLVFEPIIVE